MARRNQTKSELLAEIKKLRDRNQMLEERLASLDSNAGHDPSVHESDEHFRLLMDFMPSLVFLKDHEGRYMYLNDTYEKRFVQGREWRHKTDYAFWDRDSADLFRTNDKAVMASNQVHQFLEDSKDIDGNRFCWLCYKFPFTDSQGRKYLGGIGIDATELVLAQEALRESEERFRALVTAGSQVVYRMSSDWKQLLYLQGKDFVPDTEVACGTWLDKYIPQEDQQQVTTVIDEAVRTKSVLELEHRVIRVDGTLGWTFSRAIPLLNEAGQVVEWFGAASDITDRKVREATVEAELRDLNMLQEISDSLIEEDSVQNLYQRIVDAAATVMRSDCASLQMYYPSRGSQGELYLLAQRGFSTEAGERSRWVKPTTSTTCGQAIKRGVRVMESDLSTAQWMKGSLDYEVVMDSGICASQSTPLFTRAGFLVGMLSTHWRQPHQVSGRDLSLLDIVARQAADLVERRQTEETLTEMNLHLEQRVQKRTVELTAINKELESFCYSVTHELGAPLRTMSCFSSILLEEYAGLLDSEGESYLRRIAAAASRMGRQVEDLLMLSRVTRREVNREDVDLSAMALEILKNLREQEPGRQVAAEVPSGIRGLWDMGMVKLALQNLLGNAWKYSATTAGSRIEFGSFSGVEGNVFYVRDNGIGFDMSYSKKIFLPFERLHRIGEFEGNGIGLATVQRVIDMHGGRVWAEAEVGKGATFFFTGGPSFAP